jgi:hypothetical protein
MPTAVITGVSPQLQYPFVAAPANPPPAPPTASPPPTAETTPKTEPDKDTKTPKAIKETKEEETPPGLPTVPEMLGDQAPISILLTLRPGLSPKPGDAQILVPSPRYFKISDNDSPQPHTRSYFSFNYFRDWGNDANGRLASGIDHTRIHREIFGWEWASPDGNSSFGLRFPLQTYNAANDIEGLNGTHTTFGDLALIFKEVVWRDDDLGDLISGGLAIVTPTGPSSFAGVEGIRGAHDCVLQPFVGSIWRHGSLYLQHFTAVDAPCNLNDVVVLNNDVALGWFLYQKHRKDGLSAVVPTFEVHVNTPLNHRGLLSFKDQAGTADSVDVTGGIHFEWCDASSLGIGFATPITGPRMFDFEIVAQLRWRF